MRELIDVSSGSGREQFLRKYVMHRSDVFARKWGIGYAPSYDHIQRVIDDHLSGKNVYGAYQLCEGTVAWICYDIDDHDGKQLATIDLECVTEQLTKRNVNFYVEKSGSRNSYHVWVFLEPAVPVEIAYNWARLQLIDRGIPVSTCEVFPKQQNGDVEFGNLVKMPFAFNRQTMRRSCFMEGDKFLLETTDISDHVIEPLPEPRHAKRSGDNRAVTTDFRGIRPCIRALVAQAVQLEHYAGHRLRMAIAIEYLKRSGTTDEEIAKLFAVQKDFDMRKSLKQVRSLHGYTPNKCATIREHALALDQPFDINEYCKNCTFG